MPENEIKMEIINKYWDELIQTKFEIYYLDEYLNQSHKADNIINMILAISSTGSVATWAIWDKFPMVWGGIIAISQVINAIKIYFPFNKRIKAISTFQVYLQELFLNLEYNWQKIIDGELTKKDVREKLFESKKEKLKLKNKYFANLYLPNKKKLVEKADKNNILYFEQNNYLG